MQISLKGQVAWITGGAAGLGRSIAMMCAECGASVAVSDIDAHALEAVAEAIRAQGVKGIAIPADVTDEASMQQAMNRLIQVFGRLDLVFANAGTNGTWAPIEKLQPDEWRDTLAVNLTGTYLTAHVSVPHLKLRGGSIVIVSSVNGTRIFSNAGATAYSVSKAGQLALGKMLALELAPFRIRVNIICPGSIDTEIHDKTQKHDLEEIENPAELPHETFPLKHTMAQPEQIARLAIFLSIDAASHITGTPIWIDGAESLIQG